MPRRVAADHGYGEAPVYKELEDLGVKKVTMPKKGKLSQARKKVEPARGFRDLVKWRTGSEGRIAVLKHRYGWARSLMDGTPCAATWCGWGIFAHKLGQARPLGGHEGHHSASVASTAGTTRQRTASCRSAAHATASCPTTPSLPTQTCPRRPGNGQGRAKRASRDGGHGRGWAPRGRGQLGALEVQTWVFRAQAPTPAPRKARSWWPLRGN